MGKLDGKVAIITGAAGGIGIETAKLFLEEGAKLALVDLSEEDLKEAAESLNAPDRVITIKADVSEEADVKNYVETTINEFERVDILFNNAGVTGKQTDIVDLELDDFKNIMSINAIGVFLGLKHVLAYW